MLTYLIIILDDTSTSFCHYNVLSKKSKLIGIDDLKAGVIFAMKENLNIQFVYPNYELPKEYLEIIDSIDHTDIKPIKQGYDVDVVVLDRWEDKVPDDATCILRCSHDQLAGHFDVIKGWLEHSARLNVVITNIDTFNDVDIENYRTTLIKFVDVIAELFANGHCPQLNILTDRLMLSKMNNCGAGYSSVTLAPNGSFYLCPAFYIENESQSIGDLKNGLSIKNKQLLRLDHAPICSKCDAYHCRRCIWMNQSLTMDINTPSHQQCVVAHIERNASRELQIKLENLGVGLKNSCSIKEITELDPFNIINKWK